MHRTRVKICGITRAEDGLAAVAAGADALGFVFYPDSPRALSVEAAADICSQLPPLVTTVGLFVDAAPALVEQVLDNVPLSLLQFHGEESLDDCERYRRPYIKAIRMRAGIDLQRQIAAYPSAAGILLDSFQPGVPGGTGEIFDWESIPQSLRGQVILAGGLTPDNVGQAIGDIHPYAVDVSGGVESAKGIKDAGKIQRFIEAVAFADRSTLDSE